MFHNQDQTLFFTAVPLAGGPQAAPGSNVMDVLNPPVGLDALMLHLGALVWNKTFSSVQDLLINGVWCQPIPNKKLWAHPAIAAILRGNEGEDGAAVRIIMEWITRNHDGNPMDERNVDVMLWLCASLCRIRIKVWVPAVIHGQDRGRLIRERVHMTPKMPDGPTGLAAFAAWDETAATVHLLQRSSIEWQRLEPSRSEPLCELRRYDNATYTNIVIAPFVAQCPVVHTCSLALDQLMEGAYIYQVYLCKHEKRAWPSHIYQAASGLYVYRSIFPLRSEVPGPPEGGAGARRGSKWTYCTMVRLDSNTWPYFLIPYDTTRCVCAVFASSQAEAEQLLEQWV